MGLASSGASDRRAAAREGNGCESFNLTDLIYFNDLTPLTLLGPQSASFCGVKSVGLPGTEYS